MAKLVWDQVGERIYETGVKQGVLYVQGTGGTYPTGVAWDGLISISESPSGGEPTPLYADDIKYANPMSNEEFGMSIEAYTYPDEFGECDGSSEAGDGVLIGQQKRKTFGLSYRTVIGNDTDGNDYGYKLHLIYGCLAKPSEKAYSTVNDSPETSTFSWEVTTTPVAVDGFKPTASIVIDSTKCDPTKLASIETKLYGSESEEATLPLPNEIVTMMAKG